MSGPTFATDRPQPGAVLANKFRVLRQIGEGGMGVVLEAENLVTGKRVAIKWMQRGAATHDAETSARFLREARAAARIRHPNVVDIYDVVQEDETLFMVMELLEGEPLSSLLERGGIADHELIALLLDAMRGVAEAHNQGVVHRDIKPDNIFLARETDRSSLKPIVVDFGISKLSEVSAQSLTTSNATLGTPLYMSSEQLRASGSVDARTDVYAFGVILYEAMTGIHPFDADSLPELIVKIMTADAVPPREVREEIPRALERVILKAMARERDERHPTLLALIAELQPFAHAAAFQGGTEAHGLASAEKPRSSSPLRWIVPAVLAAGCAAGAAALFAVKSDDPVVQSSQQELHSSELAALPPSAAPKPELAPQPSAAVPAIAPTTQPQSQPIAADVPRSEPIEATESPVKTKRTKPQRVQKPAAPAAVPNPTLAATETQAAATAPSAADTATPSARRPLRAGKPSRSEF